MDWKKFWDEYRLDKNLENQDRYIQVGKTVDKMPISQALFNKMIEDISDNLRLSDEDVLLEMCCGNGLITEPLSQRVEKIYAFDFTERLIEVAKNLNPYNNIRYEVGDAKGSLHDIFKEELLFTKVLMNDSLGYFDKNDLCEILRQIKRKNLRFYITGVPSDALKWEFYNTQNRKAHYLSQLESGNQYFDGIGRWWRIDEFLEIARDLDMEVSVFKQPTFMSKFRINVLFWCQ